MQKEAKRARKEAKRQKNLSPLSFWLSLRSGNLRQCEISRPVAKCRDECEISRAISQAWLKRGAWNSHISLRYTAVYKRQYIEVITGRRIASDPGSVSIFSKETLMTPDEIIANQKAMLTIMERIEANQSKLDKLIANQSTIIENQNLIKANQDKLDKLLANQEIIQSNQARILANQSEIISLLGQ
jgi:hypothetical protein